MLPSSPRRKGVSPAVERIQEQYLLRRAVKHHSERLLKLGFGAWHLQALQHALARRPKWIDEAVAAAVRDTKFVAAHAPRSRAEMLQIAVGRRSSQR